MDKTYIAQINATTIPSYFGPAANYTSIGTVVSLLVPVVQLIAALIFLAMLFLAAYNIITAGGDPEKVAGARKTATFAIVGLVVIVLSFLIVRILGAVLNVEVGI